MGKQNRRKQKVLCRRDFHWVSHSVVADFSYNTKLHVVSKGKTCCRHVWCNNTNQNWNWCCLLVQEPKRKRESGASGSQRRREVDSDEDSPPRKQQAGHRRKGVVFDSDDDEWRMDEKKEVATSAQPIFRALWCWGVRQGAEPWWMSIAHLESP
jgi:hypothetical protein